VRVGLVSTDFFDVLQIPLLAGRAFSTGDLGTAAQRTVGTRTVRTVSGKIQQTVVPGGASEPVVRSSVVLVNRSFAQRFFGSTDVIGRRFRYAAESAGSGEWYEVMGVVADFPASGTELGSDSSSTVWTETRGQIRGFPNVFVVRIRARVKCSVTKCP
jgi:hypothetical protein